MVPNPTSRAIASSVRSLWANSRFARSMRTRRISEAIGRWVVALTGEQR
jgi:hypothetical protein